MPDPREYPDAGYSLFFVRSPQPRAAEI